MEVIYLLIAFSLLVALIFLGLFFWAVKSGQFDDQYTPSMRILFDNTDSKNQTSNQKNRDE
ncbi:MAG: cbb3-type cytochrome oxidase assembly protein CcoS [Balneola sp.]|jgi:cbb3-type cytochrome oxidase maturation protein|nr:cbb3-type cytochrome oxidase assembly protein CcoS [Balneola sp.]MBE78640.1 cbb3-type cytochrome oxidase assembly protein CcoS [Balneola sp.]HBX66492.1 cbb3-type cytochrome oxidase assembly protein CcoS [Balneolaceae bacterium]|tara:strand:- start:528 stop:710 length:183 start_codon:yes stop_codon:yes gene_type:complete